MRFNDEAMGEARKALALVVPEAGQRVSPTVVVTMVKAAEALTEAVLAIGLVPDGVVEMVDRAVAAMPVVEDKAADEAAAEWVGRLERVRAQLLTVGGKSGMAIAAARRSVALARRGMALSGGGGHQVYRLSEALVAESVAAASVGDEALALASVKRSGSGSRAPHADRSLC
jgi:hypothetical protein